MTHGTFIPLPTASAPTRDHLLKVSSVTVSYHSLNSNHAHFTVSAAGPQDFLTVPQLVQDHQNPFRISAQYTQNALSRVSSGNWSLNERFEAATQHRDVTVEVVIFSVVNQRVEVLAFPLAPGQTRVARSVGGRPL